MKHQTKKIQKQKTDENKSKLHVYEILASGVPKQVFFVWKMNGPTAHEVDKPKPIQLTVYTLTSVCRFSILFSINFLRY